MHTILKAIFPPASPTKPSAKFVIMPDLSGGKVYDRMKEINGDVTVLLSSGYSLDGQAAEILKPGCNGFIQKPFNMKQLSHNVLEMLQKN